VVHQISESDSQNDGTVTLKFPLISDQRRRQFKLLSLCFLSGIFFQAGMAVLDPQCRSFDFWVFADFSG
jgi:hypothetical protein